MDDVFFGKWQTGTPPKNVPCLIHIISSNISFIRVAHWSGFRWVGWSGANIIEWCQIKRPSLPEGVRYEY